MSEAGRADGREDAPVGQLIAELSEQSSQLIRDEIRLAQSELVDRAKLAVRGAAFFGGAGLLGFFGFAALIRAGIALLNRVLPEWASSLIVSGILFAGAGIAARAGREEIKKAAPTEQTATTENLKRDVGQIKERGLP